MSLEILEPLLEKFSIEGDARETLQDIVTTSSPKSTDFFQKVLAFQRANSVENSFFPELVNALQKAPKSKKPSNKSAAPSKKTAAKKRRSSSTKSLDNEKSQDYSTNKRDKCNLSSGVRSCVSDTDIGCLEDCVPTSRIAAPQPALHAKLCKKN